MRRASAPLSNLFKRSHALTRHPAVFDARVTLLPDAQRQLAQLRDIRQLGDVWFTSSPPQAIPTGNGFNEGKPPDEGALQLGKTVRVLHERLPTLLASPLPHEILSPQIQLYLFPSTHPHLPTASGRIPYSAALWTAPVAWGRVPVVGNIRLHILSERMVKNGPSDRGQRAEKLIVKWKTSGKSKRLAEIFRGKARESESVDKMKEVLGSGSHSSDENEFSGLFIFHFDEKGRIVKHVIEHAQEGGDNEKFTKVVSVAEYLLGLARGKKDAPELALGYCEIDERDHQRKIR